LSQTTGTIAGTPRHAGRFRVVVQARDVLGAKAKRRLAIRVAA